MLRMRLSDFCAASGKLDLAQVYWERQYCANIARRRRGRLRSWAARRTTAFPGRIQTRGPVDAYGQQVAWRSTIILMRVRVGSR